MNWSEELKIGADSLVEAAVSNPKVQTAVAALGGTVAAGTYSEVLKGPWAFCLGLMSFLGLVAMLRKNWLDADLTALQIRLLTKQVEGLGATPITEDIPHDPHSAP